MNNTEAKVITAEIKDDLINFFSAFDSEKTKMINDAYNMLASFGGERGSGRLG